MAEEDAAFLRWVFNTRPTLYYANEEDAETKATYDKMRALFKDLHLPVDPVELLMQDGEELSLV